MSFRVINGGMVEVYHGIDISAENDLHWYADLSIHNHRDCDIDYDVFTRKVTKELNEVIKEYSGDWEYSNDIDKSSDFAFIRAKMYNDLNEKYEYVEFIVPFKNEEDCHKYVINAGLNGYVKIACNLSSDKEDLKKLKDDGFMPCLEIHENSFKHYMH